MTEISNTLLKMSKDATIHQLRLPMPNMQE